MQPELVQGGIFSFWFVLPGLAGLVLLAVVCLRKKKLSPGMFAPLFVTSLVLIISSIGLSLLTPFVDVVSNVSSGEAEDSGN